MDLDDIKRNLRAEINKRKNEQYATFQCNVSQMCKDVLAKLEEQESVIAENDKEIAELEERIADDDKDFEMANSQNEPLIKIVRHHNYKRCLAMARWFKIMSILAADYRVPREKWNFYEKWHKRWLELSEKFKEAK